MKRRRFGWTGVPVSVIGQGTWETESDRKSAIEALSVGLDLGMNHIDTAEMYGSGAAEEIVGEAIAGRRDEVFLASKVLPDNASFKGTVRACERSLRRLGTDHLDLYLLHWPSDEVPLEETVSAFEALVRDGKIRSWGLSNFDVGGLERALAIAGDRPVACDQVLYHLEERAIEHAVIPFCERHEIAVVAYSPFGSGKFPGPRSRGGRVLAEIAAAHGVTPYSVALAFLVRRRSVFAIPKSSNIQHVGENAAAASLALSEEELRLIDAAFPLRPPPRELPTL
jgi:diketogulonate reductase-like aldo/keto reductase